MHSSNDINQFFNSELLILQPSVVPTKLLQVTCTPWTEDSSMFINPHFTFGLRKLAVSTLQEAVEAQGLWL